MANITHGPNTSEIADRHYRSVTDDHFARAITGTCSALQKNSTQTVAESGCLERTSENATERNELRKQAHSAPVASSQYRTLTLTGFEAGGATTIPGNTFGQSNNSLGAECGALSAGIGALAAVWADLPADVRKRILDLAGVAAEATV